MLAPVFYTINLAVPQLKLIQNSLARICCCAVQLQKTAFFQDFSNHSECFLFVLAIQASQKNVLPPNHHGSTAARLYYGHVKPQGHSKGNAHSFFPHLHLNNPERENTPANSGNTSAKWHFAGIPLHYFLIASTNTQNRNMWLYCT